MFMLDFVLLFFFFPALAFLKQYTANVLKEYNPYGDIKSAEHTETSYIMHVIV